MALKRADYPERRAWLKGPHGPERTGDFVVVVEPRQWIDGLWQLADHKDFRVVNREPRTALGNATKWCLRHNYNVSYDFGNGHVYDGQLFYDWAVKNLTDGEFLTLYLKKDMKKGKKG